MRATSAICASLALTACGGAEADGAATQAAPRTLADCEVYAERPEAMGWCRTAVAPALTETDVETLCGDLSFMESECRSAWTMVRLHPEQGFSTEALLAACGGYDDCALEVLDARPDPDIAVQLALCAESAGDYTNDCAHHSLQRWKLGAPTPAEAQAIAQTALDPRLIGGYLGEVVGCLEAISCVGDPTIQRECEVVASSMRADPVRCEMAFRSTGAAPAGDAGSPLNPALGAPIPPSGPAQTAPPPPPGSAPG